MRLVLKLAGTRDTPNPLISTLILDFKSCQEAIFSPLDIKPACGDSIYQFLRSKAPESYSLAPHDHMCNLRGND